MKNPNLSFNHFNFNSIYNTTILKLTNYHHPHLVPSLKLPASRPPPH